jgi:hypothetical protein
VSAASEARAFLTEVDPAPAPAAPPLSAQALALLRSSGFPVNRQPEERVS